MPIVIGLTGGIGSGKSTVAEMLADRGAIVIDADRVAHEVYAPGTHGYDLLIERFGEQIISEDGGIDRTRLGAIVFHDRDALNALNAIIHPLVRQEVARRMLEVTRTDPDAVIVIEAALMTETGWSGGAGTVWTVIAEPEIVTERLVGLRGMDVADVHLRLAAQATNEQRRKVASRIIENDGTLEDLEDEVERAWQEHTGSLHPV